jgi:hypothetical protein
MKALKNYYKTLLAALAALLCLIPVAAQISGYLTVREPQKVVGKRNVEVQVKIPVSVQAGFHVNSNTPNEEYLIPLRVTWTDTGALQPGAISYPKPRTERYDFSPKPLSVFTGDFDLLATFKVAPNAKAGPGIAAGKLRYQACNDKACFPPRTIDVKVPYQIQ